ncbi:MAG: DAK2 domain-containing protein [Erysipelotrichaceae bacterium]|nr:DAK2 domain-containing protein [Erysipelotrichaceae bacterium]
MTNINVEFLRDIFVSGTNNISNNYKDIDALNVFPIPDGDTGTNMMMTIQNGVKNISSVEFDRCGDLATSFAKGLLLGARGNSGVILSQIFRGFADAVKEKQELVLADVVNAFKKGTEKAYKAVLKPVEGTMLTVIKDASNAVEKFVLDNPSATLVETLNEMVNAAKISLENTPNLLPVLKEAGVVDSGGAGIVKILEGFLSAAKGEVVETQTLSSQDTKYVLFDKVEDSEEDEFGYCTEFVMRLLPEVEGKIPYNQEQLREFLEKIGASVVLVNDEDLVKVHVHTYKPGDVFNYAQQFGEFITIKVENMDEQHDKLVKKPERKKQAIVTVAVGEGLTRLFTQLRVDIVISGGQTMNPSIEDFVKAISKLNPESVIILPNNSNIVMSAKQAAEILNKKGIETRIVPTTSIQQGISACMGYNPDCSIDENIIEMFAATKRVVCGQITTAVRDSKLNGVSIKSGDFIGIKEKKIVAASKDINKVAISLVSAMMNYDAEIVTIIAGCDVSNKTVKNLEKYIKETYHHVEVEIQQGDQPVYQLLLAVE